MSARWNVTLKPEIRDQHGITTADVCRAAPDSGLLVLPACVAWDLKRMATYYMPTNDDVTCAYCLKDRVRPRDWLRRDITAVRAAADQQLVTAKRILDTLIETAARTLSERDATDAWAIVCGEVEELIGDRPTRQRRLAFAHAFAAGLIRLAQNRDEGQ